MIFVSTHSLKYTSPIHTKSHRLTQNLILLKVVWDKSYLVCTKRLQKLSEVTSHLYAMTIMDSIEICSTHTSIHNIITEKFTVFVLLKKIKQTSLDGSVAGCLDI